MNTSSGGTVTVTNSGLAYIGEKITSEGAVRFDDTTTGSIWLGADIETTLAGSEIFVDQCPATLIADVALTTNDGDITLDEILDDTGGLRTLTLAAGDGTILVDDNVGFNGTNVLAGLVVESAGNLYFSGLDATVDVIALSIGSITPVAVQTEFDAAVNTVGNIDINTALLTVNALVATADGATVTVTNSDVR